MLKHCLHDVDDDVAVHGGGVRHRAHSESCDVRLSHSTSYEQPLKVFSKLNSQLPVQVPVL
jgi:hypothetical protein